MQQVAPVLRELAVQQKQPSPQSLLPEQASARQKLAEGAPREEQARAPQEREVQRQRKGLAEAPPRQASFALLWRLLLSLPFRPRLFARPRLPRRLRRGSACALFRPRRRLSNSSAIDVDAAERVRKHFRDAADEEAAAEQKVVAEKAAKEAAAKAARMKPAVAAPPPAPSVAAAPRAPAVLEPAPPVAPLPPVSVVPKPAPATVIAAKPVSAVSPVPVKPAVVHSAR